MYLRVESSTSQGEEACQEDCEKDFDAASQCGRIFHWRMALLGKDLWLDIDGKHVSLSLNEKKRGIVMDAEAVASSARLTNTTRRMKNEI